MRERRPPPGFNPSPTPEQTKVAAAKKKREEKKASKTAAALKKEKAAAAAAKGVPKPTDPSAFVKAAQKARGEWWFPPLLVISPVGREKLRAFLCQAERARSPLLFVSCLPKWFENSV